MIDTIQALKLKAPAGQRHVFVLVSSDGDFAACAASVRDAGHAVVVVLKPNAVCSKRLLKQADILMVGKSYQLQGVRRRGET